MLAIALLKWWYSLGWQTAAKKLTVFLTGIGRQFSIVIILETLFSPWKQLVATNDPNRPINLKLRGVLDNLISRFVGFWIRLFTLLAGLIITVVIGGLGLISLLLWPFVPVSVFWLILKGLGIL
jgi:hypothetical protein